MWQVKDPDRTSVQSRTQMKKYAACAAMQNGIQKAFQTTEAHKMDPTISAEETGFVGFNSHDIAGGFRNYSWNKLLAM